MIVKKAYNIRLYPNKGQANFINKTIGGCKFAYNLCLKSKQYLYNNYGVSYDPKMALLTEEYPNQLGNIDSQGLCNTYQDLKKAYSNWFNSLSGKNNCKQKVPKFKNTKTKAGSYRNAMIKKDIDKLVQDDKIFLPCAKWIKFKGTIEKDKIRKIYNITVKRTNTGKYFASLCCDVEIDEYEHTGEAIGLDLGIKDLIITSNGTKYDNKKFLKETERKIKHLQREHSRKKKGSHNREKARLKLAKSIADCSFSMIRRMLEYKCKWHNRQLIIIDRWSPSSKTCNSCGHIMKDWNLGIREWDCPNCGTHHDRDVNAAKNILDEGMKILDTVGTTGSACGVDSSVVEIQSRSTVKQESPLL